MVTAEVDRVLPQLKENVTATLRQQQQQERRQEQQELYRHIQQLMLGQEQRLEQRLNLRFDRLERMISENGIMATKAWNATQHHGPFQAVMTPGHRHLTELNPALPQVTSVAALQAMDWPTVAAIFNAYYPHQPVPATLAMTIGDILRAVGCNPRAFP
ncbi:hypothetical protein CALVIDRAFT_531674 [Calocera viscosa TUFC12733]|uniref:Mug135-like C-terminal domain-containing protein n=1 Tax=Calocera viscosa (strain TUFC12733) TaxID=1330018 RepID=A0A167G2H6_CALVF|nr:hypothetical protein CALVIDRAFT_531674 [Calocera viscosa TUFC12733]